MLINLSNLICIWAHEVSSILFKNISQVECFLVAGTEYKVLILANKLLSVLSYSETSANGALSFSAKYLTDSFPIMTVNVVLSSTLVLSI